MRRFLRMLLAVLLCTTAMCQVAVLSDVNANTDASNATIVVENGSNKTSQISVRDILSTAVNGNNSTYSEEEVFLAAQLINHEAHNQSYNGKVAVAEVLINRIKSTLFPNTINDVISQKGQFSNSRRIKNIQPTEVELRIANSVLNGNLRVFNDEGVLYFRNPAVTSGFSAKVDKDWGSLDYVTYIGDHAFYSQSIYDKQLAEAREDEKGKEKKSIFDKLPTRVDIAAFGASLKESKTSAKAETIKNDASKTEPIVVANGAITPDASDADIAVDSIDVENNVVEVIDAQTHATENSKEETEAAICEIATAVTGVSEEVAQNAMAKLAEGEDLTEFSLEETVYVSSAIMLANASVINEKMSKDTKDTDEINPEEEEIDESDPAAVAQRQARIDEKLRVQRIAELEAANVKANEEATKLAEINIQQAVDRAETLVKAGQVEINE